MQHASCCCPGAFRTQGGRGSCASRASRSPIVKAWSIAPSPRDRLQRGLPASHTHVEKDPDAHAESSRSREHPGRLSSSNTCSAIPYGGPANHRGSSVMRRRSVLFVLSVGSASIVTTSCGSSEMATTTRVPTSVQRQRLPPQQNSSPIENSRRSIGCFTGEGDRSIVAAPSPLLPASRV